jgi:peptide/nickel transport system ATP-binding protein
VHAEVSPLIETAVAVSDLRISLADDSADIVEQISFEVSAGEVLAIVGESGSGKTTVATALLGYTRRGAYITGGSAVVARVDLLKLSSDELRSARGRLVAYMPQDPSAALNPALRIRTQLAELFDEHAADVPRELRRARITEALHEVKLPSDEGFLARYPHQLSGGQQQRCALAMAFLLRPTLIVLDEPTTGLDVTTQAHVLRTVGDLCRSHRVAMIYITHDLAVVGDLADRVVVMYAGRVVESGSRQDVFGAPVHPYTKRLLEASPDIGERYRLRAIEGHAPAPRDRPGGCSFRPRCEMAIAKCEIDPPDVVVAEQHRVRCHRASESTPRTGRVTAAGAPGDAKRAEEVLVVENVMASYGRMRVLNGVSLALAHSECLALVGESGSGKTTLARAIMGLLPRYEGRVILRGATLAQRVRDRPREARQTLQYIFQSPYNSLNPRKTVGQIIGTPLRYFFGVKGAAAAAQIAQVLDQVALPASTEARYPHHLSGGERQRVAIARALVCQPQILVCDEITSALDVSVQAAIVQLLEELREKSDLSIVFVTHNLALVRSIADRVIVMHQGSIVESGATESVLRSPREGYTKALLDDTPSLLRAGGGSLTPVS